MMKSISSSDFMVSSSLLENEETQVCSKRSFVFAIVFVSFTLSAAICLAYVFTR